jgi:hypothetical protein
VYRCLDDVLYPPLDLRTVARHPIEAEYLARGRQFLVEVPLDKCRTFARLDQANPLVATMSGYAEGRYRSYSGSPLERFFKAWRPRSILDALDVVLITDGLHKSTSSFSHPEPWNSGHGVSNQVARLCEPFSTALGDATYRRLIQVFESVGRSGRPGDTPRNHIQAQLLMRGLEFRVLILRGKHRASAIAAHRLPFTPVQLGGERQPVGVRREDAPSWPQVRSGGFTLKEALERFDRLFEGQHSWVDHPAQ